MHTCERCGLSSPHGKTHCMYCGQLFSLAKPVSLSEQTGLEDDGNIQTSFRSLLTNFHQREDLPLDAPLQPDKTSAQRGKNASHAKKPKQQQYGLLSGLLFLLGLRRNPNTGTLFFKPLPTTITVTTLSLAIVSLLMGPELFESLRPMTIQTAIVLQIQTSSQQGTQQQLPVTLNVAWGKVCQAQDNGKVQKISNQVQQNTTVTKMILTTITACDGSYNHKILTYQQKVLSENQQFFVNNKLVETCKITTPYVNLFMTGTKKSDTLMAGKFRKYRGAWACDITTITPVDPSGVGNWVGNIH